jgi:hypothetical protein
MQMEISDPSVYSSIDNWGVVGGRKQEGRTEEVGQLCYTWLIRVAVAGSYTP